MLMPTSRQSAVQEADIAADVAQRLSERSVSPSARDLVVRLLAPREAARLSVAEALRHAWLTRADSACGLWQTR